MTKGEEGDVSNYLVMAQTKAEEKAAEKEPKKKSSVSEYPFEFVEKNYNKRHSKKNSKRKKQIEVSWTKHAVTTEDGKLIHRRHLSGPILFQNHEERTSSTNW